MPFSERIAPDDATAWEVVRLIFDLQLIASIFSLVDSISTPEAVAFDVPRAALTRATS